MLLLAGVAAGPGAAGKLELRQAAVPQARRQQTAVAVCARFSLSVHGGTGVKAIRPSPVVRQTP